MTLPFRHIVKARKLVSGAPAWSLANGADKQIALTAALEIEEKTIRGFELVIRAKVNSSQGNVSFSLIYHPSGNRREAMPLARLDWRPNAPHTNLHPRTPASHYLDEIDGTHLHPFEENWSPTEMRPLKGLPIAMPVKRDFSDFQSALAGAGEAFNVARLQAIPEPMWVMELPL